MSAVNLFLFRSCSGFFLLDASMTAQKLNCFLAVRMIFVRIFFLHDSTCFLLFRRRFVYSRLKRRTGVPWKLLCSRNEGACSLSALLFSCTWHMRRVNVVIVNEKEGSRRAGNRMFRSKQTESCTVVNECEINLH